VFENAVLRRIFRPEKEERTGDWRKLHDEELYNLYYTADDIRMIKSWKMIWAGYTGEKCIQSFCRKAWREKTTWKI
jgi:hypothetical protein